MRRYCCRHYIIRNVPSLVGFRYQRAGERRRPARGLTLASVAETRALLEARFGRLVLFEAATFGVCDGGHSKPLAEVH